MSSQQSFQSIVGKFSDGLQVLSGITRYNPSKEELKLTSLQQLHTDAETKNALVISTGTILKDLRNERRELSFRISDTNPNCLENLFTNCKYFLSSEFGSKSTACLKISGIIKNIRPTTDKKEDSSENAEPSKSRSNSEKSYQSLVGFGRDVVTVITALGANYNPSNENLTPENIKAKVDQLQSLNSSIVQAELDYNNAVRERRNIYEGEYGIKKVKTKIKEYLASFEGGKKNEAYISYHNAVK